MPAVIPAETLPTRIISEGLAISVPDVQSALGMVGKHFDDPTIRYAAVRAFLEHPS